MANDESLPTGKKPHPLSRAPDGRACAVEVRHKDGSLGPCGRWVLGASTSRPEKKCVSHSKSRRANEARARRAQSATESRRGELGRREEFLAVLHLHMPPRTIDDVRQARRLVVDELVCGSSITPAEARELRALLADEERSLRADMRDERSRARSVPAANGTLNPYGFGRR